VQTGGYYKPDPVLCSQVLRPSATLNAIVQKLARPYRVSGSVRAAGGSGG
jgi:hypothetical protein